MQYGIGVGENPRKTSMWDPMLEIIILRRDWGDRGV